jgi:putative transposase
VLKCCKRRWHGAPAIANTDQGSQFTNSEFVKAVLASRATVTMNGKGDWRDNVFIERLWRSLKYKEVYLQAYASVSYARLSLGRAG